MPWSFLASTSCLACLWVYGTRPDGSHGQVEPFLPSGHRYEVTAELRRVIERPTISWASEVPVSGQDSEWKARSDHAVRLIYEGDHAAAIAELLEVERLAVAPYAVAANLGTAYELAGNLEEAHRWITRSLERDVEAHFGTEWLHQLLLERKLAGERTVFDPVRMDEFDGSDYALDYDGTTYAADEVLRALIYQLLERTKFVKPEDPYVADLFLMAGWLAGSTSSIEPALEFLEIAREYGHPDSERLESLIERAESMVGWSRWKVRGWIALGVGAFALLLGWMLYRWAKGGYRIS